MAHSLVFGTFVSFVWYPIKETYMPIVNEANINTIIINSDQLLKAKTDLKVKIDLIII